MYWHASLLSTFWLVKNFEKKAPRSGLQVPWIHFVTESYRANGTRRESFCISLNVLMQTPVAYSHVHLAERVTRLALPSAVVASSASHWIYWQCLFRNNLSAHFLSHCYLLLSIRFLPLNHCCCPTEPGTVEPSAVQQNNHSECIMVWLSGIISDND